jgi:hypothetical protein
MTYTIYFYFKPNYEEETLIDHFTDVDDDTGQIIVTIYDVEEELIETLTDKELCEHFGLNPDPDYWVGISIDEDEYED